MIKFFVDTQLPPLLAKFLAEKDFDAIHTTDFPEGHLLQDTEIVKIAISEQRIIITKDSDFLDNYLLKGAPPKILLLKLGNISNRELLEVIDLYLQQLINQFESQSELIMLSKTQLITYNQD
jgi:predicted nuclease of predicted toxin-antitoxin system